MGAQLATQVESSLNIVALCNNSVHITQLMYDLIIYDDDGHEIRFVSSDNADKLVSLAAHLFPLTCQGIVVQYEAENVLCRLLHF